MVRFAALLFVLLLSGAVAAAEVAAPGRADGGALRAQAGRLFEQERFGDAAEAFTHAARVQPDDPAPVLHIATLVRLGRMEEAQAMAEAAIVSPTGTGDALRLVARAMTMAGEVGRARLVLDAALVQAPSDISLLTERAELETSAGRPIKAIPFAERALSLAPADPGPRRALARALLAAGMPVRAARAVEDARAAGIALDADLLSLALAALQAYGDHRAAVDLAEAHADRLRESAPVLRALAVSLAALGARERSAERLVQALALAPPDAAAVALIDRVVPEERRAPLLDDLRRRFPDRPELFRTGGTPPRDLAWPWLAEAAAMDRPHARAHLARALADLPPGRDGQRVRVLMRLAEIEDRPDAALAGLEAAEALGHVRGEVLAARFAVLSAAGRWDAAAPVAWDWARTRPDDGKALAALFTPEVADRIGWARAFAHLHDHVQRDPDDPDRRLRALDRHAGTGGSAVLALAHAQALERLVAGDDPRHRQGRLLKDVVTRVLEDVGRVADVDLAAARLVMETRDGRLEARADPVTGRLLRFALGERWIVAEWSPDRLDLVSLTDGHGNRLKAFRRDGRLVRLEASGRAAFRADIGPDGAPTAIVASSGDARGAAAAYNAALALLDAWPRTGLGGARWLKIGP